MNILYTCDNNYVWLMGISVISLFENNKSLNKIKVYLLGEGISEKNKKILGNIANKYNRSINIIETPQIDIPSKLVSKRWPTSAFTRLFSGEILSEELEEILYLDCDTIITGDISNLLKIEIGDVIFAGVKDCISSGYKRNIGLDKKSEYINAGVLYINLKKLRKINVLYELENYLDKYINNINYADQDILNGIFNKKIKILPPEYDVMTIVATHNYDDIIRLRNPENYYSSEEIVNAQNKNIIIHYTTNMRIIRPWYKNSNHPLALEFSKYLSLSPWKNKELNNYLFTSKEAKLIKFIDFFPNCVAKTTLGFIHSTIKPIIIKLKSIYK